MTQRPDPRLAWSLVAFLGLAVASQVAAQAAPPAEAHTVIIAAPKTSAIVKRPNVHVVLKPQETLAGQTARHHLFLDRDLSVADTALPAGVRGIVHLGPEQYDYKFSGVAPGRHRLIAVLADSGKWATTPLAADTVYFAVR